MVSAGIYGAQLLFRITGPAGRRGCAMRAERLGWTGDTTARPPAERRAPRRSSHKECVHVPVVDPLVRLLAPARRRRARLARDLASRYGSGRGVLLGPGTRHLFQDRP